MPANDEHITLDRELGLSLMELLQLIQDGQTRRDERQQTTEKAVIEVQDALTALMKVITIQLLHAPPETHRSLATNISHVAEHDNHREHTREWLRQTAAKLAPADDAPSPHAPPE